MAKVLTIIGASLIFVIIAELAYLLASPLAPVRSARVGPSFLTTSAPVMTTNDKGAPQGIVTGKITAKTSPGIGEEFIIAHPAGALRARLSAEAIYYERVEEPTGARNPDRRLDHAFPLLPDQPYLFEWVEKPDEPVKTVLRVTRSQL